MLIKIKDAKEVKICCVCGKPYEGNGNNAEPYEKGRCCDKCNQEFIIPFRIKEISKKKRGE